MKLSIITSVLILTSLVEPISIPLSRRLVKRATGSESLTNDNNQLWYGTISVGTPANTFTVSFDTGSADLFLPGQSCSSCNGHTIYDISHSSTSVDLGKPFTLQFGDGSSVSGEEYTDTVSISGLTATTQTLGVASQYPSSFSVDQFPPDGILGMGFPEISGFNELPFMQTLISQGQCSDPVFAFKLTSSGSELFICGVNSALYTGDFIWTPVTQVGYWQVNLNSINANNQTVIENLDAIIDTGSSLVVLNSKDAANLYNAIGGKDASSTVGEGFWTFPCDSFPDVSFTFGGKSFSISSSTLNLGQVSAGSSDCVSGIKGDDSQSFAIIGGVFLQNVYTAFDIGNTRVGFANLS